MSLSPKWLYLKVVKDYVGKTKKSEMIKIKCSVSFSNIDKPDIKQLSTCYIDYIDRILQNNPI